MSKYTDPHKLIDELLFVVQYAETDLKALRQADNSGRVEETLREIGRVKELVKCHMSTPSGDAYPYDLFK